MKHLFVIAALVLLAVGQPAAEHWPQWRGPLLNGISAEKNLPVKWSATDNVAWKLAMPAWSGSTPIIWGDHLFLNVSDGKEMSLWAIDRANGAVRWKRPLGGGDRRMMKQNMSSPSPVTDGKLVWVMTGAGVLKSFDFAGKELWTRDIQRDYGRFGLQWGYASSPLLFEDALYVQVLHGMHTDDPSYLLRIDKTSGKTVWRTERPTRARFESPDAYTTPALLRYGTTTEIVVTGGDVVTGHEPASGKELWRADGLNPRNDGSYRIVASPIVHGDLIFAPSRERPLLALKPGGRGDVTSSHVLWSFNNGPDVPTPVTDGTYLYSINDRGIMFALEAKTGKTVYGPQRLRSATYSGSAVLADGKIYITDEDGVTSVIQSGPKFSLLAENDLGDYTLSSPAISEGQIFVRTASALYAIGQRRK
ncbi:MAG TPA: PQQ-binding-like beta-propeller repeat protein [Vicinamibacterales bacterium]|jgi:outer membrane protein assembly factor BamB|nr:PQQ-binding-like beta-propeller repeat protein [Vicinamibacterales bacterium]